MNLTAKYNGLTAKNEDGRAMIVRVITAHYMAYRLDYINAETMKTSVLEILRIGMQTRKAAFRGAASTAVAIINRNDDLGWAVMQYGIIFLNMHV